MIKSFADKNSRSLFERGTCRICPSIVQARAVRKLDMLDSAERLDDLKVPPGNRLHALSGSYAGKYSIAVNDQWRICFIFANGNAYDVEFCDYH